MNFFFQLRRTSPGDATAIDTHVAVGVALSSSSSLGTEDILYLILLAGGHLPTGSYLLPCSEAQGQGGARDAAQEAPNNEKIL
jgi:hypothetical protein